MQHSCKNLGVSCLREQKCFNTLYILVYDSARKGYSTLELDKFQIVINLKINRMHPTYITLTTYTFLPLSTGYI